MEIGGRSTSSGRVASTKDSESLIIRAYYKALVMYNAFRTNVSGLARNYIEVS